MGRPLTAVWIGSAAALVAGAAFAERIELKSGDMVISAPAEVDCASPPDFTLENGGAALFAGDRSALDDLVSKMALGLTSSCTEVDTLTVRGTERGVTFEFAVTRENDWRLDAPVAPEAPEAAPTPAAAITTPEAAAPEAPEVAAAAPEPELEPEAPAEPAVEPGLDFTTFTSIFGSVPTVRGHVSFDNSEIWARVLAARMYAENPEILANDTHAIELLAQMATQPEYVGVLGPLASKRPEQMSVFERRDIAERIRTQLRGGLDQRRQTGPILVYNAVGLQLREYDFNTQSFPLPGIDGVRNHRQVAWKNVRIGASFSNLVLPSRLPATQEQARQLDAYLRGRNDLTLYLAVFAEIDPAVPPVLSNSYSSFPLATNTKITQVALFADRGLSQVLYDFTADLSERQAAADAAAAALGDPVSSVEDAIRAIDAINGSAATSGAFADFAALNDWTGTGQSPEARRADAAAAIAAASADRMMRLSGSLQLGTYDSVRGVFPITRISTNGMQFNALNARADVSFNLVPTLNELPVDAATAAGLAAAAANQRLEFRLDAEMMQGSHQDLGGGYLRLNTILRPDTIQIFSGRQNDYQQPRTIVLDLELPESVSVVPSLMEALTPPN